MFLTLPVSFKGRIIQIYDYSEPDHPLTTHMRRKRMTAYRSMGYRLAEDAADDEAD